MNVTGIITITTDIILYALKSDRYQTVIEFALIVGLGYLVANTMNIAINTNIPKPTHYGIIRGSYNLVGIMIVCIIILSTQ